MEFRAGAHMGKKGSQWKEATAAQKCFLKTSKRVVILYGNSKIINTNNSNNSSRSSNSNKRGGSIWLRHLL